MYKKYIKRILDILLSFIAIILLSPVILIVAILVRTKLGSPILFKQERPGKNGKIFKMYKFRTMTDAKNEKGELLPDAVRLTRFGRILRSTSLDELPELLNILKGDMSIVGPRPLLVEYLPLYSEEQMHRHDVRPGLTGLAQISGRNLVDWQSKFKLDVEYVNNLRFKMDLKIILNTVKTVIKKEGISDSAGITMEKFKGNTFSEEKVG